MKRQTFSRGSLSLIGPANVSFAFISSFALAASGGSLFLRVLL